MRRELVVMNTLSFSWLGACLTVYLLANTIALRAEAGSDVKGGDVKGGDVTGSSVSGGTVTPGTVTPGTVTPGVVKAVAGDRQIQVSAKGAVSVNVEGANAKVYLDKHVLEIRKDHVTFDGKDLAPLDPKARKIEIRVEDEMLCVKDGGKEVFRVKLDSTGK